MGATQSKKKTGIEKIEEYDIFDTLDIIATKYIVNGNLKDMEKLVDKEYCDKLVIVTTDVISHYFKEKNIKYLARNTEANIYKNNDVLTRENIMWIQRPEIAKTGRKDEYKEESYQQYIEDNRRKRHEEKTNKDPPSFSYLDVKDSAKKTNMCKGIAKFYITIGHIWAAILLSVNPRYKYLDPATNKYVYIKLEDKAKIPKQMRPEITREGNGLCDRRIMALGKNAQDAPINLSRVCKLNKSIKQTQMDKELYNNWGHDSDTINHTLINEVGIPELENLYKDYYDYNTGVFSHRIPGGKADKLYKNDLKRFYSEFTDNTNYDEWNADGEKGFKDIILYQFEEECEKPYSIFKRDFEHSDESNTLFKKYGDHIKNTNKTIKKDRQSILSILHTIFVKRVLEDKTELITIDPTLTEKGLDDIVILTRERIVKLYLTCEKNFTLALDIVKNISLLNVYELTDSRKLEIEKEIEQKITESKPDPTNLPDTIKDTKNDSHNSEDKQKDKERYPYDTHSYDRHPYDRHPYDRHPYDRRLY